jgi:hypothetical protein
MTPEQLIAEGRVLQRPCVFLRPKPHGPVAAIWHDWNLEHAVMNPNRPLISVDTSIIPATSRGRGEKISGYVAA